MRYKRVKEGNYIFKHYQGNFQKLKYDSKKEDYFLTFHGRKFYLNEGYRGSSIFQEEYSKDQYIIGNWQEGYCVYLLVSDGDISETERGKIVYCPPASEYVYD